MTAIMKAANDTPNSRRSRNLIPSPSGYNVTITPRATRPAPKRIKSCQVMRRIIAMRAGWDDRLIKLVLASGRCLPTR